jgi:Photosynthetic reaction centre cytochrome C subunit
MFRTIVMAAAIATLPVLSPCALLGQEAPPPSAGTLHKPMMMPKPVNLKVLPPNTSPQDVMKIMMAFTQQLGVKCNFCHAEDTVTRHPNFASDMKAEKNTARTMMLMTQDINGKYMSQIHDPDAAPDQKTVACGTCHRGHSMPVTFKPAEHPGAGKGNPGMGDMNKPAPPPKQ